MTQIKFNKKQKSILEKTLKTLQFSKINYNDSPNFLISHYISHTGLCFNGICFLISLSYKGLNVNRYYTLRDKLFNIFIMLHPKKEVIKMGSWFPKGEEGLTQRIDFLQHILKEYCHE